MIVRRRDIREVEMDLTGTCNLNCYICTRNFIHSRHMVRKNMRPLREIRAQLDTFPGLKTFFLAGVVSEPTLHPEFTGFLDYLNGRDIVYELYTNGNTHDDGWWESLGRIVPEKCRVVFTVCGSTQEIHERYRVGSSLEQILAHAAAFRRNGRRNDWVQHILFEYNRDDVGLNGILRQFSHSFQVHSEGRRMDDRKIRPCPDGVCPPRDIDTKINYIFSTPPSSGDDARITCKLDSWKKIYIDQFGNLFPCYTYAEYGLPPLPQSAAEFDITDIVHYRYKQCFLCSKRANDLIDKFGLDFVC